MYRRPSEQVALSDRRRVIAQITPCDLDIAVLGKLPATQLPLSDHLEPGLLEVVRLYAYLWRRTLIEEGLEDAPTDPDDALIRT